MNKTGNAAQGGIGRRTKGTTPMTSGMFKGKPKGMVGAMPTGMLNGGP